MELPLSDAERVDARRFLGYEAYGLGQADPTFGRYNRVNITLEYRLANLQDAELVVARRFLDTLNTMENDVPNMSDNLVAASAGPYTHNARELSDRTRLLAMWSGRFAEFLGVPRRSSGGNGSIRLVV